MPRFKRRPVRRRLTPADLPIQPAAQQQASDNSLLWLLAIAAVLWFFSGGIGPVTPPPIATEGFRVLIIEETEQRGKLPLGQLNQLTAVGQNSVIAFLRQKCVATPSDPGWKIIDKDSDVSRLGEPWVAAWANKGTALPWLLVSNGRTGYSGPLPATAAETLKIMAEYAPKSGPPMASQPESQERFPYLFVIMSLLAPALPWAFGAYVAWSIYEHIRFQSHALKHIADRTK